MSHSSTRILCNVLQPRYFLFRLNRARERIDVFGKKIATPQINRTIPCYLTKFLQQLLAAYAFKNVTWVTIRNDTEDN